MSVFAMQRLNPPWQKGLEELHGNLNQVVQSFISAQTEQLNAIEAGLASQIEALALKEKNLAELGDSISEVVEAEARRLKDLGFDVSDGAEAEACETGDAVQRMKQLWYQAKKTFEFTHAAKEQENSAALEEQRRSLEEKAFQAHLEHQEEISKRDAEISVLQQRVEALHGEHADREDAKVALSRELQVLNHELSKSQKECERMAVDLEEAQAAQQRLDYQWSAEREELLRTRDAAQTQLSSLQRSLDEATEKSAKLEVKCVQRAEKLEQMRTMMDEQELEMSQKIERVQQYVKERQAAAVVAEKKQQDAEKMAERWQNEVRRYQVEKERLSSLVMELEGRQTGQVEQWQGAVERHRKEVNALEDALKKQECEMKEANSELLSKRDEEYQAKVALEKQREKERSIALLKKKEQEVHIKDQQLRAAKQRIQELESELRVGDVSAEKRGPKEVRGGDASLPPLLSAR